MSHLAPRRPLASGRSWLLIAIITAALFASACGPMYVQDDNYGARYSPQSRVASNQVDFGYLNGYGVWTNTARFGQVWVPHANRTPGWRPYFYGHWDYTNYGWTWASDEAWVSGPYHYGRWAWHNAHRWVWIPGNVWGPAWVTWRSGGGCVGWAPMGPSGYVYNQHNYWTFVYQRNIYRRSVRSVIIPHTRVAGVYRQTVRIGRRGRIRTRGGRVVTYNSGPRRTTVQTWTRSPVRTQQVGSVRSASPRRRGPAARTQPRYRPAARPAYRPAARTVRPAARPAYRPTTRPTARPAYRPAPRAVAPSRGAYRPAPSRGYRPAPRAPAAYRPAPRATRPAYRPAPSTRGRAAPGRAAPGYNRRANPYNTAPRATSRTRSSSRPTAGTRPTKRSSRPSVRSRSARRPAPRARSSRSSTRRSSSRSSSRPSRPSSSRRSR